LRRERIDGLRPLAARCRRFAFRRRPNRLIYSSSWRWTTLNCGLAPQEWTFPEEIGSVSLDKKQKKQLEPARKRLQQLQQRLAGARKQPDDPGEISRLEREIAAEEENIRRIQGL
jgi:hypothetical protein